MGRTSAWRDVGAWLHLLRWLGPWADAGKAPDGVEEARLDAEVGEHRVEARVFLPAGTPRGTVVLALGLHPFGPDDVRAIRFARILAGAGFVVFVPYNRALMALDLHGDAPGAFAAALEAVLADPRRVGRSVGIMSISFGSWPALTAASQPHLAPHVHTVVTFGGFGDVRKALDFALTGELDGRVWHDDLGRNLPVAVLQIARHHAQLAPHEARFREVMLRYVVTTWETPELKYDRPGQAALARELAAELPEEIRELWLQATAAVPGGLEMVQALLHHLDAVRLDARPHLPGLRAELHIVHGRDDTVIPYTEAMALAAAAPRPARVYLTGLFGHTGTTPSVSAVVGEVGSLAGMLSVLARLGVAR